MNDYTKIRKRVKIKMNIKQITRHKAFPYAAAFLLPFVICIIICIGNGVYPFGDNCILHIDMYHQYCPFFVEFLDKLRHGGSFQYSWNLGMGSDFVSLYAYYLASPLNFLILLCPKSHVIEFMTLLVIIKIALCGLTFFLFIRHHYHLVGKDGRIHDNQVIPALAFSTAYALSGYIAAYSWNIMWLDCIALFPLIVVGLEKLVQEKKPALYYITLAVSIFSNYYISIMICIFLVFYFALLFFSRKEGKTGALWRFIWYSMLAGISSAVLLLPEIAAMVRSGVSEDTFPKKAEWYFNLIAELGRGASMASVYTANDHWPNLYAGAFSLVLVWVYLLNKRISWKEKLPRMLMLGFLLISFAQNQLDYIWHGMHFPQSLPGRQSFLYIFMILSMGFAAVRKWKGTKIWHIMVSTVFSLGLLFFSGMMGDETVTEPMAVIITGLFVCVYGIILLLTKLVSKKVRFALREFVCCIVIAELAVNMALTGLGVTSRVAYTDKELFYDSLLKLAEEDNADGGFYRIEDNGRKTKNDNTRYGYRSVTIFSSLMNLDVSHFFQSVYMEGGKNYYCYNGATPLPSSMFCVKYLISSCYMEESKVRTLVGDCNGNYLYKNRYCLPFGFMMDEQVSDEWVMSDLDRIRSLNTLAGTLGAKEDMIALATCTMEELAGESTIDIAEDGYYYADYVQCDSDSLTVTRSDGWTKQYSKTTHRYLIELGECKAGTQVRITNDNSETISYHLYRLNFESLDQAYGTLCRQTMQTGRVTDTEITGTIDVKDEGRLVLPVPADEGWELYVDGIKTRIQPFKETLIGVHLKKGTHDIQLRYATPGLKTGALLSAGAILAALLCLMPGIIKRKRGKDGKKES